MSVTWKSSKGPSGAGGLQCTVRLLDATDAVLDITKKTEGNVIFDQIIRRLEITQKDYFGLEFEDDQKVTQWLDLTKPVKKQLKRTPYRVTFKVRYYPIDPMVSRPSSRTQFYQQVRRDIIEGKLRCSEPLIPGLFSYILQADLGDYESVDRDIEYMSDERIVSNEDISLQEEVSQSHKLLRGMNSQESVNGFLRKVRDLDNYGMVFYEVKYEDSHCRFGISPGGVSLYQRSRRMCLYDWTNIVQVSFKSKKFLLTVKENGKEKHHTLERDSTKAAKELWTICAENASFYCESRHRQREEVDDSRSPDALFPSNKDVFGYPNDSSETEHQSFGAKVKKSKSLPRNLPSDDSVLLAAMHHRKQSGEDSSDAPTSPGDVSREPPNTNSMQIILPDMPSILDQYDHSEQHKGRHNSHGVAVSGRERYSNERHGNHNHKDFDKTHHSPRGYQQNVQSEGRPGELKSGSSSRLSKSSRSTTNLSQDDDMDGSLLDLADELGDDDSPDLSSPRLDQTVRETAHIGREPEKLSSRNISKSPRSPSNNFHSHTLPWAYNSPGNTPPPKPPRDSPVHANTGSSPYQPSPSPYQPGSSPYQPSSSPYQPGSSPYQPGSSLTSEREHKKKKSGRNLVRKWVQEQQLRTYQSSQNSLDSTSSSSIGANLGHLQPSPELKTTHARHTPPSPLVAQPLNTHRDGTNNILPDPRHWDKNSSDLYDHVSHSKTLPSSRSPRRDRITSDPSPKKHEPLAESSYSQKQLRSREADSVTGQSRAKVSTEQSSLRVQRSQLDSEMDDLMVDLVADTNNVNPPSRKDIERRKLPECVSQDQAKSEFQTYNNLQENKVEQARHDRRATERKLRKSQKIVNQVLSDSRDDVFRDSIDHPSEDLLKSKTSRKVKEVGFEDLKPSDFSREEDIVVDPRNLIDAPSPIYDRLDNVLDNETTTDMPDWVQPREDRTSNAPREVTPLSESSLSDRARFSSPSGGANLRDILQEVMEGENLPPPPAHLLALSQDLELSGQRSPEPSSDSLQQYTPSTSPPPVPTSSLSSVSKSSSEKQNRASFDRAFFSRQKVDLQIPEREGIQDDMRPRSASKLPPEIASFMSRVRNKSIDNVDSSHSLTQSDGLPSSPHLPQIEQGGRKNNVGLPLTSTLQQQQQQPGTPLVAVPPTYDSPRLVRMEMSGSSVGEQTDKYPSRNTASNQQRWIDDDNPLEAKVTASLHTSSSSHVSSANPQLSASTITTVTTGSPIDSSPAYDTPKAVHKQLGQLGSTNVVYPEQGKQLERDPLNKASSFSENGNMKGLLKHAQRDSGTKQTKNFARSWNTGHFAEAESGYSSSNRRMTEPEANIHIPNSSHNPVQAPSPSTPLTPLSQHTHSDLVGHTFTYPAPVTSASIPDLPISTHTHQPPYPTEGRVSQGYTTRPDTGQGVHFNQSNPRSRNYKTQSQAYTGGDIRRVQTFNTGRDSSWSNSHREEPRKAKSPSDDSLPNSPTYFIQNNPNDDRDTPSPATQAHNESFQEHLKALEVRGSKKLRVLDWMQRSSDSWKKDPTSKKTAPLKKDVATDVPSQPYYKQAPIYASIDDIDSGVVEQRPGRQVESRQSISESRHRDQRQKLSSQSAAGYDMEHRHSSMTTSRPYSRHDVEQKRAEMERRPNLGHSMDGRPGSGRSVDSSNVQRRAHTFSYPRPQVHQGQGSSGLPRDQRGGVKQSGQVTNTGQCLSTSKNNSGYPSAKVGYVLDV